MGRKKKRKNVDFQKVKLKVGKRLPKGLNVTDTTFKAKKIILPNQAKRVYQEEPGTPAQKNLILQDLLKKLQHYNPSTRHDVLTRLKELMTQNIELILPNLSGIISRVAETMVDKDWVVRRSSNQVLAIVLQNIKEQEISPFFPVLCSYLTCAMTHIDAHIKHDSLLYFNAILDTFPCLLLKSSDQMLKNFLNQISSENAQGSMRTLSVSPGFQITSQAWRLKVLRRLEKFLATFVKQVLAKDEITERMERIVFWSGDKHRCIPLYPSPQCSDSPNVTATSSVWSAKQAQVYASSIMPLLLEIWIEAYTAEGSESVEKNKIPNTVEMLECMLHIMRMLGEWLEKLSNPTNNLVNWFRQTYSDPFKKYFMKDFPFREELLPKHTKKKHEKPVSLETLNLGVLSFYYFLSPNTTNEDEDRNSLQKKLHKYIRKLLSNDKNVEQVQVAEIVKIVETLLGKECQEGNTIRSESNLMFIMHSLWNLYSKWPTMSSKRQLLFNFFVETLLQPKFKCLLEDKAACDWLRHLSQELSDLLKNPVYFKKHITAIHRLASRNVSPLIEGLQKDAQIIIGLLFELPPPSNQNDCIQKDVLDLIVKIPELSFSQLRYIVEAICTQKIAFHNVKCFVQNLSFRLQKRPNVYVNFILSIIVGTTSFRCESSIPFDSSYMESLDAWVPRCLCLFESQSCKPEIWDYHLRVVQVEVSQILSQSISKNISKNVSCLVDVFAEMEEILPVHSACGIVVLLTRQFEAGDMEDMNCRFVEIILALCAFCFVQRKIDSSVQDLVVVDKIQSLVLTCIKVGNLANRFCERFAEVAIDILDSKPAEFTCYWLTLLLKHNTFNQETALIICTILDEIKENIPMVSLEIWWQAVIYELSHYIPMDKLEKLKC